jgi:hypothetical protein
MRIMRHRRHLAEARYGRFHWCHLCRWSAAWTRGSHLVKLKRLGAQIQEEDGRCQLVLFAESLLSETVVIL